MQDGPFILSGAPGNLGRQVIDNLIAASASPIIAISRSPEKLADLADKGVEARKGDFNDLASLGAAFAGGKRLLIISTDDLEPGKRLEAHKNTIAAASKEGITHIVYAKLALCLDSCLSSHHDYLASVGSLPSNASKSVGVVALAITSISGSISGSTKAAVILELSHSIANSDVSQT